MSIIAPLQFVTCPVRFSFSSGPRIFSRSPSGLVSVLLHPVRFSSALPAIINALNADDGDTTSRRRLRRRGSLVKARENTHDSQGNFMAAHFLMIESNGRRDAVPRRGFGLKWRHKHFLANIQTMDFVQLRKRISCFAPGYLRQQSVVPLADGPIIQAVATQSLAWDCAFGAVMSTWNKAVPQLSSPLALFSNYNPILKLGIEKVMSILNEAGVCGLRPPTVYDTFISYKRDDTLHPVSHLKSALDRREIRTFIDFTMDGGVKFRPAINRAIEQSKSAVVVISPNFHSSPWCLEEVVKILQCHERWGLKVLPIFWGVDARELREQSGFFEENIGQGEKVFKQENPQQVLKWRNALQTLGMFNGWHVNNSLYRTEAEVIEDLAAGILKSLNNSEEPKHV